jgi:hypothetical protein
MLFLALACKSYHEPFDDTLAADGLTRVVASLDSGDFRYQGAFGSAEYRVSGDSSAYAKTEERAAEYESGNEWTVTAAPPDLLIHTASASPYARVDIDVIGPDTADLTLQAGGDVSLDDVAGTIEVDAEAIYAEGLGGSGSLTATSGMDVALESQVAGEWVLTASGNTTLHLPRGSWDVQVWGDPSQPMTIDNHDFDRSQLGEGYFAGLSGTGAVRVQVYVSGGTFTLTDGY